MKGKRLNLVLVLLLLLLASCSLCRAAWTLQGLATMQAYVCVSHFLHPVLLSKRQCHGMQKKQDNSSCAEQARF